LGPERIGSHDDESGMSGRDLAAELLESQPAESAASPERQRARLAQDWKSRRQVHIIFPGPACGEWQAGKGAKRIGMLVSRI
jgi:hypothetical protein